MKQQYLAEMEEKLMAEDLHIKGAAEHQPIPEKPVYTSKRIMDIGLASLGMILGVPVAATTAAAIKIEGIFNRRARGPVFFSQERVAPSGRKLRIYKFRSMELGKESAHSDVYGGDLKNMIMKGSVKDSRITGVGRFLRKYGIDELPQMYNVLIGDMSIVGPRPYTELVDEKINNVCNNRADCPPGITGPMQIERYNNKMEVVDMVNLDREYASFYNNGYNVWKDMGYVVKTLGFVLSGRHQ